MARRKGEVEDQQVRWKNFAVQLTLVSFMIWGTLDRILLGVESLVTEDGLKRALIEL